MKKCDKCAHKFPVKLRQYTRTLTERGAMASACGMGFRSASKSYTSGTPVGMLRLEMTSSGMLSRYFTRARRELPNGIV
jgi:hypothetical protein